MTYTSFPQRFSAVIGLVASLSGGCGSDDTTTPPPLDAGGTGTLIDAGVASSDGGLPTASGGGASAKPLYVSSSRVFANDSSSGYLFAFGSLDKGTAIDLKQGIEIDDGWVFGDAKPYFYVATIFKPRITRWTVSAEGKFEQGPSLDLTNQGVEGAYSAAAVPIFSAEKSYFVDPPSLQVVVWNPSTMTVLNTIPLPVDAKGALTPSLDPNVAIRGNRVFVTQYSRDEASMNTKFGESSRVFAIDTATDTIVASQEETRCGSLSQAGTASDGSIYYGPWDYFATTRGVFCPGFGTKSCLLRIAPSADGVDTSYELDLSTLVGGRPAGSLQMVAKDELLLHVWHNDVAQATAQNWSDKRFEAAYFWYRWKIGEASATLLPDQKPSSEGSEFRNLDGKTVSYVADEEYANTAVWQLQADGRQTELLTIPGWTVNALRAY